MYHVSSIKIEIDIWQKGELFEVEEKLRWKGNRHKNGVATR